MNIEFSTGQRETTRIRVRRSFFVNSVKSQFCDMPHRTKKNIGSKIATSCTERVNIHTLYTGKNATHEIHANIMQMICMKIG